MKGFISKLGQRFGIVVRNNKGFTSVEYGFMLGMVVVMAVAVGAGFHSFVVGNDSTPSKDTVVGALQVKAMEWVNRIDLGADAEQGE